MGDAGPVGNPKTLSAARDSIRNGSATVSVVTRREIRAGNIHLERSGDTVSRHVLEFGSDYQAIVSRLPTRLVE